MSTKIHLRRMSDGRRTGEKVRRHSYLAGQCEGRIYRPINRRQRRWFMKGVELVERHTRTKGKRTGILGYVAREVMEVLLQTMNYSTGRLDPSLNTLAERTGRCKSAVVRALKALRHAGFVDWIRRYVPTHEAGRGVQVKQTSNAYRLTLPPMAVRLLGPIYGREPPVSADLAFETAKRAQQIETNFKQDSPIFARCKRAEDVVRERESAQQSQSLMGFIFEVAETKKGNN
jgi:DNA-binding MarR family transcriptional regulator